MEKEKKKRTRSFLCGTAMFGIAVFLTLPGIVRAQEPAAKVGSFEIGQKFGLGGQTGIFCQEKAAYVSETLLPDFAFNAVGLQWRENLPSGTAANIYIRILEDKKWTDWTKIEPAEETLGMETGQDRPYFSDLIFASGGQAVQYKIKLQAADCQSEPSVFGLKITYIDSSGRAKASQCKIIRNDGNSFMMSVSGADNSELHVIPRSQWIDKSEEVSPQDRQALWPAQYVQPKKIIVHHTGISVKDTDGDGIIGNQDYLAAMRAIYQWQAKVIDGGWKDVGYNYLIDPDGRIYEGRYGDDGVVGGHTVRSEKCDREKFGNAGTMVGFNRGTIGIALLGNFENDIPTAAAIQSLSDLVAYKALEFDIDPEGESIYAGISIPNVVGHRDVDCTLCPGKNLYAYLFQIRQNAQQKYDELRSELIARGVAPKARLLYQSDKAISVKPGETKEVWADFKNEGTTTWHNYTNDAVYLAQASVKSQLASLDSFHMVTVGDDASPSGANGSGQAAGSKPPYFAAKLVQPNVRPGETGTFKFSVTAPQGSAGTKGYVLTWGDQGWFTGTDLTMAVNSTEMDYNALLVSRDVQPAYLVNASVPTEVRFRNAGTKPWPTDKIVLNIYGRNQAASDFKDSGWNGGFGGIRPTELASGKAEILPGEEATFRFSLKMPDSPKLYENIFKLEFSDKSHPVSGGEFQILTRVDAPLAAELLSANIPSAILNLWRPSVSLKFKNVGSIAWDKNLALLSYGPGGTASEFRHPTWASDSVIENLDGTVQPGQIVTFSFQLQPPTKPGSYSQVFALKLGQEKVFINGNYLLEFPTRVDGDAPAGSSAKEPTAKAATTAPAPAATTPKTATAVAPAKAAAPKIHIVKAGEYLDYIAAKYGISVKKIMSANKLTNPNRILVGQKLIISN